MVKGGFGEWQRVDQGNLALLGSVKYPDVVGDQAFIKFPSDLTLWLGDFLPIGRPFD